MITKNDMFLMLKTVSELWKDEVKTLERIDSTFGDGDHGITIEKIALTIDDHLENENTKSIADFFEGLGDAILGINGGSAGPLYGTFIGSLGLSLSEKEEITKSVFKQMFQDCLEEMQDITTARVGDKTMMDALIPAIESIQKNEGVMEEILYDASISAKNGAEATKQMIAKYGRAKSYGEQTLGTADVGAVSTQIFFQGLYEGYKKRESR